MYKDERSAFITSFLRQEVYRKRSINFLGIIKLFQRGERPLLLGDLAVRLDLATSTQNLAIVKLALEDCAVQEEHLASAVHLPVLHLALKPRPNLLTVEI